MMGKPPAAMRSGVFVLMIVSCCEQKGKREHEVQNPTLMRQDYPKSVAARCTVGKGKHRKPKYRR